MEIVFDKPNRYGLNKIEDVEYACDCFASGTDSKGNKVVMAERWQHERNSSRFVQEVWHEPICDCIEGSTINKDGSITVHPFNHDLKCPIRNKLGKDSIPTNPFFGGHI